MAEHVRQLIRANAVALAAAFVTVASEKRAAPTSDTELPYCAVVLGAESAEQVSMGSPRLYERTVALAFRVIVSNADGYEDALDAVFANIEKAVAADHSIGGVFSFATFAAISDATEPDEGELEIVSRDLIFTGVYRTSETDPATPITI